MYRPVLHDGAVMQWSAADERQRHPADVRSSSPGLLAFIPFAVAQDAVVSTIMYALLLPIPVLSCTIITPDRRACLAQHKAKITAKL